MTPPMVDPLRDAAVCRTLYLFAQGIDLREWDTLRSVLADEVTIDYTSYRGGEPVVMAAQDWIGKARRRFATMTATQHSMTNPRVDGTGEQVTCRMYVEAHHVAVIDGTEESCRIGGEYVDELHLIEGDWLITTLRLDVRWFQGNRAVLDLPTN